MAKLDRVRDRLVLRPFGSKNEMNLAFDLRTKITQNGQPVALKDIKPGSRVYADTMLNGEQVFASMGKTFFLKPASSAAAASVFSAVTGAWAAARCGCGSCRAPATIACAA